MEFLKQPIRRYIDPMLSTLIEEVGESLVPEGTPAHGTRRTVVEVALNEATGVTVKRVDLRRGCSGSSEKGLRIGASAPSLTPCPTRISAFEKAVSVFVENPTEDKPWLVIWMN
ncbi:hypothetical protein VPH35_001001 [Triticum aestivum]